MTISLILDLVLLAVLVSTALYYRKKGFVAGIVHLGGTLISLIGAWLAASTVSPAVFEKFFKEGLVEKIHTAIDGQATVNLADMVERFAGFLPDSLKQSILSAADGVLDGGAPDAALSIVENVIAPLLVPIISIVVFFVCFAICRLLVGLLTAMLTGLNRIPVVGSLNRVLGFVTGAVAGLLNVFILLCAAWAILVITGGNSSWWNEAMLEKSLFYQVFAPLNPFL